MGAYGVTAEASKSYFNDVSGEALIAGDINKNGKIDKQDFALIVSDWLKSCN
jgi:hypothetical protein